MSTPASAVLGIDVGGTAVKLGFLDQSGTVLGRRQFPFDRSLSFEAFVEGLVADVNALTSNNGVVVSRAGIATPGYADPVSNVLVDGTANVPCLKGRSLVAALSEQLRCPASIINDGLAAATAELRLGIGREVRRFVVVTLGTGVGGGLVLDGAVQSGPEGHPPEVGALVLDPTRERADGRSLGTFEMLACSKAFVRRASGRAERLAPCTAHEVFARAAAGDAGCREAIDVTARWIAQALGGMINLLNLDACVIGGGVASAGEALLNPIRNHLPDFTWPSLLTRVDVTTTVCGVDSGWIGAALFSAPHLGGSISLSRCRTA